MKSNSILLGLMVMIAISILGTRIIHGQSLVSPDKYNERSQTDTVLLPHGEVTLTQVNSSIITEDAWYTDILYQFKDNLLLVHGGWKSKGHSGGWWKTSRDNGVTWQSLVNPKGKDYTRIQPFMCQRRDGSVIGWDNGHMIQDTTFHGRPGQPISRAMISAPSFESMVQGKGINSWKATVRQPYMVPLFSDDPGTPPIYSAIIWGKPVEAEYGYLIQATYSLLAYDKAPRLWTKQKMQPYKYRTCIIYSQDDGHTWQYLATVASPEQYPLPAQAEGYCEPDLLYFGKGHLLCVMRTGDNPGGPLRDRLFPLAACRSKDGGLTWTSPEPISPYGADPQLLRMKNGLVVCLSGRPGFFLLFSEDEGKSWSVPYWVSKSTGTYGRSSSGYGKLVELAPGVLGVAYDEYVGEGDNGRMVTKFRSYRIGKVEVQ